jgi:Carboxypeptidase regulatory-like domain
VIAPSSIRMPRPGLYLLALWALAFGRPLVAEPTHVAIEWHDGLEVRARPEVRVCASVRRTPNSAGTACDVNTAATASEVTLDLPSGRWSVRAQAKGFWSTTIDLDVARGSVGASLGLWPAATLTGALVHAEGELPSVVELRFAATHDDRASDAPELSGTLLCPVESERWSCSLPLGAYDLELRASSFVPHYFWGVLVGAGRETTLGLINLRRGASIAGRIQRANGLLPTGPCEAEVRVDTPPSAAVAGSPPAARRFTTPIGKQGFFQLTGVPPGERVVTIACALLHASTTVSVRSWSETKLGEPLVVEGLALDVQVVPPLDPHQRPWKLDVFRFAQERQQIATREPVSPDGRWSRRNLQSDTYQVDVLDEGGAQWQSQPLVLSESARALVIQVPTLKIAGRLRLGATPLRAQVVFTNDAGSMRLALQSDDDGLFQGHLVAANEGWERGWTVEVHATAPPVNHLLENVVLPAPGEAEAWLELSVPGADARGTVVSEDGAPQAGAQVLSASLDDAAQVYAATTDAQGTFELLHLPAGGYRVTAETAVALSEPEQLDVIEGVEQDLRLVLKPQVSFAGQVRSASAAIAGASVHLWLAPGHARGSTTTDAEGRFEFGLPANTRDVGLTVAARGFALHMERVRVGDRDLITIPLDPQSGTLVLALPQAAQQDRPTSVLIAHNDSIESLDTVIEWATQNGGGPDARRTLVPAMEPGLYRLCRVPASDVTAVWASTLADGACSSANLAPGAIQGLSLGMP